MSRWVPILLTSAVLALGQSSAREGREDGRTGGREDGRTG